MTHNVFSGTLNRAQSINHCTVALAGVLLISTEIDISAAL